MNQVSAFVKWPFHTYLWWFSSHPVLSNAGFFVFGQKAPENAPHDPLNPSPWQTPPYWGSDLSVICLAFSFFLSFLIYFSILVHYLTMCVQLPEDRMTHHISGTKWLTFFFFFFSFALSSPAAAERWSSRRCSSICISHFMWGEEQMALCHSSTLPFVLLLIGTPHFHVKRENLAAHGGASSSKHSLRENTA